MLIERKKLSNLMEAQKNMGKSIVFTNGCFDILHIGHIHLLEKAKNLGDILIVGINSDDSVRNLKGEGRPFFPDIERAYVVMALRAVDYVVIFSESTASCLIEEIGPDYYVKGGDYTPDDLPEKEAIKKSGAKLRLIPLKEGHSTTKIADKIRRNYGGK